MPQGSAAMLQVAAVPAAPSTSTSRRSRRALARARSVFVAAAAVVLLAVAAAGPIQAGTTYYVATSGSDGAAGSSSRPWRTIGSSLTRLSAGDTLVVRGGSYYERIKSPSIRSGTATSRITVRAYQGERPIIRGLLWMKGASYWTFDGINVTWSSANNASEHMVKFTNGVGWTFTRGEIWGARSYAGLLVAGSVAGQPRNWKISYSCIHDTYRSNLLNQDHNVYLNTGTSAGAGLFERNLVFNATNGRNLKLGPGLVTGGTVNVTVRYNTFYNAAQPISPSYASNHNRFVRNILGKSGGSYSLIYAYGLSGTDNVASQNVGFLAPNLLGRSPGSVAVRDGGGNVFPTDPRFNNTSSCSGFSPTNRSAAGYGRHG